MKHLNKFENFKDTFFGKPRIINSGEQLKYEDDNGITHYCTYIRDEMLKGEFGAYHLFGGKAKSIVQDEKLGRISVEKDIRI